MNETPIRLDDDILETLETLMTDGDTIRLRLEPIHRIVAAGRLVELGYATYQAKNQTIILTNAGRDAYLYRLSAPDAYRDLPKPFLTDQPRLTDNLATN